ncbi:MAG: single-stranded DNA-binding protein [Spirochaetales bacterium]|nr:single-stranded DNA-binding protein [Spirochaetales bacterium]
MNSLNSVLLEGNLVRDPEISYTPKGTALCKFTIATNRSFKLEDEYQKEVSYFSIVTWTKLAEVCKEYLGKGRGVRVVGRLKQDRWETTDGKTKSAVHVVAEHVEFKPDFKKSQPQAVKNDEKAVANAVSY